VTLVPRVLVLPTRRNRLTRQRVEAAVAERYRARFERDPERIEVDFPKRISGRAAKSEVAELLDRADPRWRRVFVLYPTESALRDAE
jgi:hypothetical protein